MKDIRKLTINQAVKLLPKKIGDRRLMFVPDCAGQSFIGYYKGDSGYGPRSYGGYTLGGAIRKLLRVIKCDSCGAVLETDQECGVPARWQVHGDANEFNIKVFCSKRCKEHYLLVLNEKSK